jgi:Rubrerythrin
LWICSWRNRRATNLSRLFTSASLLRTNEA